MSGKIESAEEFARRGWELDPSEFAEAVKSRDAAIRAECAADIEALTQKVKELKFCVDDAAPRRKLLERTIADRNATIDTLRARIAELEARERNELLTTATPILAAIIGKIPVSVVVDTHSDVVGAEKWSIDRAMRVRAGAVQMAVEYARALHATAAEWGWEVIDIVTRLTGNTGKYHGFQNMNTEAADEIVRLRAEHDRLREALEKIANPRRGTPEEHWDVGQIGDFARAALEGKQ